MKKQPLSYAHASRKTEYTPGISVMHFKLTIIFHLAIYFSRNSSNFHYVVFPFHIHLAIMWD